MFYKNIAKYILTFLLLIILPISSYIFINKDQISFQKDSKLIKSIADVNEMKAKKEEKAVVSEEVELYQKFKNAIDSNDFKMIGELLKMLYEKGWINKKEFNDLEKEIYIKVDKIYFTPGNFDKSLEITRLIYEQALLSGRFRYLFILSLEALGKKALTDKNYSKAEEYAIRILQIEYRLEGVNLLADIYIEKIRNKIKMGDKQGALNDWNYIIEFELASEKMEILNTLKTELN